MFTYVQINQLTFFKTVRNIEIYTNIAKQAIQTEPPMDAALCPSERFSEDGIQAGDSQDG